MSRYATVDWTKHDAAIARELGVTRAAVGKARRKAGAQPTKKPKAGRPLSRKANSRRLIKDLTHCLEFGDSHLPARGMPELLAEAKEFIRNNP